MSRGANAKRTRARHEGGLNTAFNCKLSSRVDSFGTLFVLTLFVQARQKYTQYVYLLFF